ncbi:MAG: efflux RND transporter periplasmic adaptor subunit [Myxococcota bacterium]|nr:efflux RND transporter periplasmic adaptor subunit [Myxococcota bacterium]
MIQNDRIATNPAVASARPRRAQWTRIVMLAVLVLVIGATAWALRERQRGAASASAAAASAASDRVIPVLTARVEQRDVPLWLEALGSVSAFYTVTVKTQVDGRVDKVLFKEGEPVKKGDILVQIDPRPFAIQLESAQAAFSRDRANLANARVNLERYRTLSQQNLIAVQQLTDQQAAVDQLDAQMRADQAQINAAKLNVDYARVTSPIDGVTGIRLVDPGNVVHASDAGGLVVVTQLDPIAVLFTLPEDDLVAVQRAMANGTLPVEALTRTGGESVAVGKLLVVDNVINQATATVRLKAVFANPQHLLWPNQFVKARLKLATRHNANVVPAAAVQHGPQGTFAYIVASDSTAAIRPVSVDATQGDVAILASGLSLGQEVVVEGQAQLRPGAHVSAKAAAPEPSGAPAQSGDSVAAPGNLRGTRSAP